MVRAQTYSSFHAVTKAEFAPPCGLGSVALTTFHTLYCIRTNLLVCEVCSGKKNGKVPFEHDGAGRNHWR